MERKEIIRNAVREHYGMIAENNQSCSNCGCKPATGNSCCGGKAVTFEEISLSLGYNKADFEQMPEGANMGLGCGNPRAIASLKKGETVLDLGSGGGFDAFLAAREVGATGKVIGVDMTPSMISLSRENAEKGRFTRVEFRLGEIEHLPVADQTIDVIISNCVINLSPEKQQVFNEAFRVLTSGGRLAISDTVAIREIPEHLLADMELYSACVSGALTVADMTQILENAGFSDIRIEPKDESRSFIKDWSSGGTLADYVLSATIEAVKK
jgi:SAM-dependent methyltransferase